MATEGRGLIFAEDAALYDRVRPRYPEGVFDDLAEMARLKPGSRVLEVGAGTGQATISLAERGYEVVALEPGRTLADLAKRNLRELQSASVEVSSFEDWQPPAEPFDVVVAATSWHWLDPATRVMRAFEALRAEGALAIISTHHVAGGDTAFFHAVQECYERYDSATPPGLTLTPEESITFDDEDIRSSGLFGPVESRKHPWEQSYTTNEYKDVLMSYSGHRALADEAREALLHCISALIDEEFDGRIRKRYLFQLSVTHRLAAAPPPP